MPRSRLIGAVFVLQVTVNIVVMAFLIGLLFTASQHLSDISQRQIASVKAQNNAQLCNQHAMLLAIKQIGTKLGLPTQDIKPPDIQGLNCAS